MRVLVTGAGGFLGNHVIDDLLRNGHTVRALSRTAGPSGSGVEWLRWSGIEDVSAFTAALPGVEAVMHLAARVHVMRDGPGAAAAFRRVNVDGTRALASAAATAGTRRFILASSVKAMGESTSVPWTEDIPEHPADPYGRSKLEAEDAVQRAVSGSPTSAVAVRFPVIHGPGMRGNMLRIFRLVDRGMILPFGAITSRRTILYSGNAAFVLRRLAEGTATGVLLAGDEHAPTLRELVQAIGDALQRPARLLPVPVAALEGVASIGSVIDRMVPFPITRRELGRLTDSLVVDTSRLRAAVGPMPFAWLAGIGQTAAWYRKAQS